MTLPAPRYTMWECLVTALALAQRALDEVRALSRVPGPRGERGIPGLSVKGDIGPPGLSIEDLALEYDGERTLKIRFARGEHKSELVCVMPIPIYRGVFKDGQSYVRGDEVTWGGSQWHCNVETADKPGDGAKNWTLATKKGRDGKDGIGIKGDPGRDGRDFTPEGLKYRKDHT